MAMKEIVQEIIGRVASVLPFGGLIKARVSVDFSRADYTFWDRLRRGKEKTYRLGGVFAAPIVHHRTSWVLGQGFSAKVGDEQTDEALAMFIRENMQLITDWFKDAQALGDCYIVVNPDGSLTLVPPDQVEVITDALDYRQVVGYTITTREETATVVDEFRRGYRKVRIMFSGHNYVVPDGFEQVGSHTYERWYPNFRERIPVIHRAEGKSSNEVYGHPVYEALLTVFAEYDDILVNAVEGVKTMSNPVPTLEEVDNPDAELEALERGTETYNDTDGFTREQGAIDFADPGRGEIFATSGKFSFKAPAPFTADAWQMLKALFMLMLQHTNIPEWVWGGAIASSKASVEAQMPAFSRMIDGLRMSLSRELQALCEIWLETVSLYTPFLVVDGVEISYPDVTDSDKALTVQVVQMALGMGLITRAKALALLDLVENVEDELAEADAEADARMSVDERFDRMVADELTPSSDEAA